jgi:hypothetical protein
METALETQFPAFSITVPPEHTTTIKLNALFRYLNQDTIDELLNKDENNVVIGLSYPSMDAAFARNASDFNDKAYVDTLLAEVLPAAATWVTVHGITTATFNFVSTEPKISKMGLYTSLPAGSTSWLNITMKNEYNEVLFSKILYNVVVTDGGWTEFDVGIYSKLLPSGNTPVFTVLISEVSYGATHTGIKIGTTAIGAVAYRDYYDKLTCIFGKLNRGVMRFNIFSRDKKKERQPTPSMFLGKDDIVSQVADQLRQYIWANWTQYGMNDVQDTVLSAGETSKVIPFASATFDLLLVVPDFGTVATPSLSIKDITIDPKEIR